MIGWKHYYTPNTISEATELLTQHAGQARVIAGGTDLLLEIREGHRPPVEALIDITHIPELAAIEIADNEARIGAGVTHTQIVGHEMLAARATCLVESCGVVGGPQVRNVGTLGGNVAHALPAGDGTVSLVTLDASVEIIKDGDRRWVPIRKMYKGPGKSLLDSTRDLLLGFRFSLTAPNEATAFKRIMRPQGVALPVLGCAVWVRLGAGGMVIDEARVVIAPVAPTPIRLEKTEAALAGSAVGDSAAIAETLRGVAPVLRDEIEPRTSKYRATAAYRLEVAEVLLRRALPLAIQRVKTGEAVPEGVGLK